MRDGGTSTGGEVWHAVPFQGVETTTGSIQGVWTMPGEDVEWTWTHGTNGSYVSGYSIKKGTRLMRASGTGNSIDRKTYEEELKRRQEEHLEGIRKAHDIHWIPCMHDSCPECVGTGIRKDGSPCVHGISCPCPKCTPRC